jgi:hypothetical protein
MKKSFCRQACMIFFISMTSMMVMAQTDNTHSSVPGRVSGYNSHVNNQNNWGLFGIIGVIALAGLTKRNVVQKN